MDIEPHHITTVSRKAVMPPKPQTQPLMPRISMAADAKRCNARLRRVLGASQDGGPGKSANEKRSEAARARREHFARMILAALAKSEPMPTRQIDALLNLSHEQTRTILAELRKEGRVIMGKGGNGVALWCLP